jgi:biopolymer transport protein ExbB
MRWRGVPAVLTLLAFAAPALAQDGAAAEAGPGMLVHFLRSVGWVFGSVFVALSVSLVMLIALLAMDLRVGGAIPPAFVEKFTEAVNARKFKEAFELARLDESFLARVLAAGMARLQYGIEDARDAAFNTAAAIKSTKDQMINYVAVISSLGPYVGLVGTVFGMILSFKELARPGARVEPQRLADGISHALVVTMVGIGLAIPGLFFTVYFRNRTTRLTTETENLADDLLTQMYHGTRKAAVPTAAAAPTETVPSGKPV